jgi:hypothetical protein
MYFDIAATMGNESTQVERSVIERLMTPDQIAEAQRIAREWMVKHQR